VRFTNRKAICQVIYPGMQGDRVLAEANSQELSHYGIQAGLTNYAAAYATGLLCARRTLKVLGMDSYYQGVSEPTGAAFDVYKDFE
jgi:large subunit ribosomal protein L5e